MADPVLRPLAAKAIDDAAFQGELSFLTLVSKETSISWQTNRAIWARESLIAWGGDGHTVKSYTRYPELVLTHR